MDDLTNITERESAYAEAREDMIRMRESFLKLEKGERERLLNEAITLWAPKTDPIKRRIILSGLEKLIG